MTWWRYIWRSLVHHRRTHLPVLASVAVATAVLTGALAVGDSVRGSLRQLVLDRLGFIDYSLVSPAYFSSDVVERLVSEPQFQSLFRTAVGVCYVAQATVEQQQNGRLLSRASSVTLLGCDTQFWQLDRHGPRNLKLKAGEIAINQALSRELNVQAGDRLTVRLPSDSRVPSDSVLGRKDVGARSLQELTVVAILSGRGLAQFSLHPSQQEPMNAFVPLETLQAGLSQPGRLNAMFVSRRAGNARPPEENLAVLQAGLQPALEDFGIRVTRQVLTWPKEAPEGEQQQVWDYFHITSDRLLWDPHARSAAREAFSDWTFQEVFTYLATSIERVDPHGESGETSGGVSIPYSMVSALDNHPLLGPVESPKEDFLLQADPQAPAAVRRSSPKSAGETAGEPSWVPAAPLRSGQLVLNQWAAERLGAHPGDTIRMHYFHPEATQGQPQERLATFQLAGVTPLTEPSRPARRGRSADFTIRPRLANDDQLTPEVEGVTDQATIDRWDPPFPFQPERIAAEDERYWERYRTTPKAFISLADGQRLWNSRFGAATSFRVPLQPGVAQEALTTRLRHALRARQTELGFQFRPVKFEGLTAAQGTTPFEYLFLVFSLFLIVASLMLIVVLFRLGVELRSRELGVLAALGYPGPRTRGLFWVESAIVASLGAGVGVPLGVAYASLMLVGLKTWWVAAIVTPFIDLHVTTARLIGGALLGLMTGMIVVGLSLRALQHATPCALLAGRWENGPATNVTRARWQRIGTLGWLVGALGTGWLSTRLQGEAQAGGFFSSGALTLLAALTYSRGQLIYLGTSAPSRTRLSNMVLAVRWTTQNPGRSSLTMGLMSAATFLLLAISAFRLAPTERGTGGFALQATSDQPLHVDFADAAVRRELFGADAPPVDRVSIIPLRVRRGDDATCRNLYQVGRPRMLGLTSPFLSDAEAGAVGFAWHSPREGVADPGDLHPWRRLTPPESREAVEPIPVVLDANTATYSLHLPPEVGHEFELDYGRRIRFRIVGLLSNTIFQGSLLLHEDDLVRLFPGVSGHQMFLVRVDPRADAAEVERLLERRFSDQGLDARRTEDVLAELLAVQNTYLSTFQVLGALGLLLGMCGLGAVQVRNIVSRRAELALLRSVGFSWRRVLLPLVLEAVLLLTLGLGIGVACALIAVIPFGLRGQARFPLASVFGLLLLTALVGLLAGSWAARAALRTSVVAALRGD